MAEATKAAFKFEKFTVPKFTYTDSERMHTQLLLDFFPKGKYNPITGIFELTLDFEAADSENKALSVVTMKTVSYFKFKSAMALEDLPIYFYKNSIAIIFPYIRSFVSTVTLQANTGIIMLGLMNLSNLEEVLIDNTEISEEVSME